MASGRGRANAARPKRRSAAAAGKPRPAAGGADPRRPRQGERQRERIAAHARRRPRAGLWGGGGALVVGLAVTLTVVLTTVSTPSGSHSEVPAPRVAAGTPDTQPAVLVVANTSGIPGVVAYDTTCWPADRGDGPVAQALHHAHVAGPVAYSVTPPVGGDHSPVWLNCGVYDRPVPNERAVHDLEHGAVWVTYRPSLPATEVPSSRPSRPSSRPSARPGPGTST